MRVIVIVQAKRSSSRGLVHYIAHSKTDPEKESQTRELFNAYSDTVSVQKANDLLKTGTSKKRPSNDELHHLVLSLRKEDFERLGKSEIERQDSLRQITRYAMHEFEQAIDADKLSWTAGIHRNTNNPHVHIAIQKEYFDKNLEKKTLSKVPTSLLPHYEKVDGKKVLVNGNLISAATHTLEEIASEKSKTNRSKTNGHSVSHAPKHRAEKDLFQQQSNTKHEHERNVLAKYMIAKHYYEKTNENIESLVNTGRFRRFTIFDEITQKKRRMSLNDLERRAEKRANQKYRNQKPVNPDKKAKIIRDQIDSELAQNSDGIKRIKTILHKLLVKENSSLTAQETEFKKLKSAAEKIRNDHRRESKKLPIPNLSSEEIEMLQAESIEKRDIRTANYLERIRFELTRERGTHPRTNEQIQQLKAKQKIAELKTLRTEKQINDFQFRKVTIPVEIDKQFLNYNQTEFAVRDQLKYEQTIAGKTRKILTKMRLIKSEHNLGEFEKNRDAIKVKLSEKGELLAIELKADQSILKTLNEFYKNDSNPEKDLLNPKYNAKELAEIESFAVELKLSDLYKENWREQEEFLQSTNKTGNPRSELIDETIAGRAIAREILTEVHLKRAKQEALNFKKHKEFQKFEVINEKTGETKFVSHNEVKFDSRGSLFDQTIEFFMENRQKRNERNQIEILIRNRSRELKENVVAASSLSKVASETAQEHRHKSFFGAVSYHHEPVFTPKELVTIELRIKQTESKTEAKKLTQLLDSVDHSAAKNLSSILMGLSSEKEALISAETRIDQDQELSHSLHNESVNSQPGNIKTAEREGSAIDNLRDR